MGNKKRVSIFHPEKFHLMIYYSVTSFIVIGIVSFLVGEIFSRMEKNDIIERSEKYAGYIVDNINYALYEEVINPAISKDGHVDLKRNLEHFNKLDYVIKSKIYGLNIKKIYLFDMSGQIIYSSIPGLTGHVLERGKNLQLDSAENGISASDLQFPGKEDSKGIISEEFLLESYYPVYEYKDGVKNKEKQVGVLEIYQDMRDVEIQIAGAHRKAVVMTSASMVLLFLTLLLIVKKASGIIMLKTKQLVYARDHLEEKVNQRTLQIQHTYEKLQEVQKRLSRSEKLAGIGTLAAGIAHEINNPLASVTSCAEGLMDRLDNLDFKTNDDIEIFSDYLKIICDETYRCKLIISKLLDFSRQHELVLGKVDINSLISEVVRTINLQTLPEKLNIIFDTHNGPLNIYGDYNQLKQVFWNITLNAIDAVNENGDIKISTMENGDTTQIIFEDTGCGIGIKNINKVFEPFFTTKEPGKGTGLGLSICYGIIEKHGGRILVDSNGFGKGTTFTVSLPVKRHSNHDVYYI